MNMSSDFEAIILPLLHSSKLILRKLLPPEEAREKIKDLRLNRKYLRMFNEIMLYKITEEQVIPVLEKQVPGSDNSPDWHCGTSDFVQHLKEVVGKHKIEGNKIINPGRKATSAFLDLVQIINSNNPTINGQQQRINENLGVIQKYGDAKQIEKLRQILSSSNNDNLTYLKKMFEKFNLR
jgi:hypothetical protein